MRKNELLPLHVQAANRIILEIKQNNFREGDILPRMNQLSRMLKVNASAMEKGIQYLVDQNLLSKKGPLEYMVEKGARETLMLQAREEFLQTRFPHVVKEAEKLGITKQELISYLQEEG